MKDQEVIDYVKKYRDSYSKDAIRDQLTKHGASHEQVNRAFHSGSWPSKTSNNNDKKNSKTPLVLVILGILPLIGIIFLIIGLVKAHKARSRDKEDNIALAAIIVGYLILILGIFIGFIVVSTLMFAFVDFGAMLPNKVELSNNLRVSQTESSLTQYSSDETFATIVFTYSGAPMISIDSFNDGSLIVLDNGGSCDLVGVKNVDLGSYVIDPGANIRSGMTSSGNSTENQSGVIFLNGHTGILEYDCDKLGEVFSEENPLEGMITVIYLFSRNEIETPSTGAIRLTPSLG